MTSLMTPEQCRAARVLLDITQEDLAKASGLSGKIVNVFEGRRGNITPLTVEYMQDYLTARGITFLFYDDGTPRGVALGKGSAYVLTDNDPPLLPLHFRVARAWLGWTHDRIAVESGVSPSTVRDFEAGRRFPRPENMGKIELAIKTCGIQFLYDEAQNAIGLHVIGAGIVAAA